MIKFTQGGGRGNPISETAHLMDDECWLSRARFLLSCRTIDHVTKEFKP